MKKIGVLFLLFGAVLFLVACGPKEPLVEVKAVDINLGLGDVGESFTLTEESDLAAVLGRVNIPAEEKGALVDANRRVFTSAAAVTVTQPISGTPPITRTQVNITVMVYNASGAAQTGLNETRDALKTVLAPTATLAAVNITAVGDQSELWAAEVPGHKARVYLFFVRRLNVMGVVLATGPASLEQTWVLGLGQTLVNRVPAAAVTP